MELLYNKVKYRQIIEKKSADKFLFSLIKHLDEVRGIQRDEATTQHLRSFCKGSKRRKLEKGDVKGF